jgi:hypothetical protein
MSTQNKRDIVNKCSKHKQVQPVLGNTPESKCLKFFEVSKLLNKCLFKGFWDLGIIKSPKVGTTQTGKLNSKKVKKDRPLDNAVSLKDDLDWF